MPIKTFTSDDVGSVVIYNIDESFLAGDKNTREEKVFLITNVEPGMGVSVIDLVTLKEINGWGQHMFTRVSHFKYSYEYLKETISDEHIMLLKSHETIGLYKIGQDLSVISGICDAIKYIALHRNNDLYMERLMEASGLFKTDINSILDSITIDSNDNFNDIFPYTTEAVHKYCEREFGWKPYKRDPPTNSTEADDDYDDDYPEDHEKMDVNVE